METEKLFYTLVHVGFLYIRLHHNTKYTAMKSFGNLTCALKEGNEVVKALLL